MSHTCHAPGCNRAVPPRMFACREHWFALPKPIRDAIWLEYRPGQEDDKRPSLRYLAVQRLACAYLVFKTNNEEAAVEALPYLLNAAEYRKEAIDAGVGDPLEDLVAEFDELRAGVAR